MEDLKKLFGSNNSALVDIKSVEPLRAHGSNREIYRVWYENGLSAVGIKNEIVEENRAFISFTNALRRIGINAPKIITEINDIAYVESDLGDITLFDYLARNREGDQINAEIVMMYKTALEDLTQIQFKTLPEIDKSHCYQGAIFSADAIEKDIHYFYDEFAIRKGIETDKEDIRDEITTLCNLCGNFKRGFFMFRDFQSRNIMVGIDELYYIDYQSGREGPIHYDVASLLFQSQANLPIQLREQLISHYLEAANKLFPVNGEKFKEELVLFALVRALQNLGAYGKLGLGQGKEYFKQSIPFAMKNVQYFLENWPSSFKSIKIRGDLEELVNNNKDTD